MIDIDHFFEYIKDVGWNLNTKQFFKFCYEIKYERLYLLFHAYEYLFLIAIVIVISDFNHLVIAAGIGYTQHLIFDQVSNPVKPMTYFISYRLKNRFSKQRLLKDDFLSSLSQGSHNKTKKI
ncbi:MAG: hypothetical protein V3R78_12210 [Thermodesulfobacteriota bacterium]